MPPSQKITTPKHNIKKKKVFSIKNAGWIVSGILHIFFYVNQTDQLYLSNNEASRLQIYVNNTQGKNCALSIQYTSKI